MSAAAPRREQTHTGRVVVDASVALKWVLEERHTREAALLLGQWERDGVTLLHPTLLPYEVSNALYQRVRREDLTLGEAKEALVGVISLLPSPAHLSAAHHERALELAEEFGRPASYDTHYLTLAQAAGCELWTADERLYNSVKQKLPWVQWIGEVATPREDGEGA